MSAKVLLYCGVLSSLLYFAMNAVIPLFWEEYNVTTQTVSELSAIDAPTRSIWVPLSMVYILLFAAFGLGVRQAFRDNRQLRRTGSLILVYSIINFYWPPMHQRGHEMTLTDVLHIVWAGITLLLMIILMIAGAKALGRRFRIYTLCTFIVFLVFGILAGLESPNIVDNLPTPYLGIWERINIGAFMIWVIVFSMHLLRRHRG